MKQTLSIRKFKRLFAGVAMLVLVAAVLACPVTARSEAVTIEQEKERGKAVTDMPDQAGPPDRIRVLVHVQPGVSRDPIRAFTKAKGGIVKYEYKTSLPNVMNLRNMPVAAIEALKKIPGIVSVVEDKYYENLIKLDESTPLIRGLQSEISGDGYDADGADVRVCVCDTGIDTDHTMYKDRIDFAAGYDFYNNDSNPEDDHGHGSHVAGIAVGRTGLGVNFSDECDGLEPFQGVAPESTLIGVKILNSGGGGYDSDIIAGIDHCADQSAEGGRADVINLSIGTGLYSGPCTHNWAVAANNAVAAGVVVVAASGNENYDNALSSPACGSEVIAVGATYKDDYPNCEDSSSTFYWSNCTDDFPAVDDIACFSNESDYLDVVAPGAVIWSASTASGGMSATGKSGTSMAAPHVAGLAALILSTDPTLTPDEVRQIIHDGAVDMGSTGFDRAYGYGRIDVINSLALIGPCTYDADCDDGLHCNGMETCNAAGTCENGTPPCEDDGLFCNGIETCNEESGQCSTPENPCGDKTTCNEAENSYYCCDNDLECDESEDCNSCSYDCISGSSGGDNCSDCFKGICDGVCHPVKDGPNCSDCTGAVSYCCGDGVCEGDEDSIHCLIDCGVGPTCGDGTCNEGEDYSSCPEDCEPPPPAGCHTIVDKKLCNAEPTCHWDNRNKYCVTN